MKGESPAGLCHPLRDFDYLESFRQARAAELARLPHWLQAQIMAEPLGSADLELGHRIIATLELGTAA